ncbi:vWA domain-containing protein [Brevibacillus sp. NPDC058079]|uniref:vWA domain-containing protein n=1 Tax=Brevibacillus sp. NPDC058079 TaxID=3346330 RepID=UPI0036E02FA1
MSFLKKMFGGGNNQGNQGFSNSSQQGFGNTLHLTKEQAVQTLNLRKETFTLVLQKSGAISSRARVAVVMDMSGSMRPQFKDGTVQSVLERLLPVALRLDDNGELDVWLFDDGYKRLESISERDFYQYVDREIMGKRENQLWGTTSYAPVMQDVFQKYVVEEPSHLPTFVIFITDGNNDDKRNTTEMMQEASRYGIFWQFIGIGHERFEFLQKLDDLTGRVIDNANFFKLNDINVISDEELYARLMNEYPGWEQLARQKGILR